MARSLTTQDVSWFLDQNEKGQLNLEPPYQRRSVWSPKDRRYFVDTILNNYPAPPVFLHKTIDDNGKSTYHVVDGKQRLETIILFTQNKIRIPEDFVIAALQGKRWNDLPRTERETFWNYTIIVEMLQDVSDAGLRSTFDRINRNSRKLSAQEMRHAKYEGWFATAAESEADRPEWKYLGISTAARAKRMLDSQFVSELMRIVITGDISGFSQNELDDLYAEYDDLTDIPDFDEDEFRATFDAIRTYVDSFVKLDASLGVVLKAQLHLYSLWGYLAATRGSWHPPAEFATLYREFLDNLGKADAFLIDGEPRGLNSSHVVDVIEYLNNARGASTDLAQRRGRHNALIKAIPPVGAATDESQ